MNSSEQEFIKSLRKQVGDTVEFQGTKMFWFTNIIEAARKNLVVGQKYKIKEIRPASSWTAVRLEEFPDQDFNYSWFR